jgi:hypothetical protein
LEGFRLYLLSNLNGIDRVVLDKGLHWYHCGRELMFQ